MPKRDELAMTVGRGAIVLALALLLLWTFANRFVLADLFLLRCGIALILAIVEASALIGTGYFARAGLSRLLRAGVAAPAPACDFLIGYPLFGTLCFLIGLTQINAATMGILLIAGAAAGIVALVRARREAATDALPIEMSAGVWIAVVCIGIILAAAFVTAQAPPVSLDELTYHLAVPRTWVAEGRAVALPLLSHSFFPLGIESADLPLFTLIGPAAGFASHFLHLIAAMATIAILFRWLRKSVSNGVALIATAAIVTTPALAITAGWSLDEWPLAGVCLAMAIALDDRNGEGNAGIDRATFAAALGAGLLMKYTFVPFAGVAIAAALWHVRRNREMLGGLAIATGAGIAIGCVFFVRNLALAGDPFAPFLGAHAPDVSGYRESGGLAGYLFDGRFVDEALGASIVALALAALVTRTGGALTKRIALLELGLGAALVVLAPSSRILLPFLLIAAAAGAQAIEVSQPILRRGIVAVLSVAIVIQTFAVVWLVDRNEALSTLTAKLSDSELVLKQRPLAAAASWVDSVLPPSSRTLVIGCSELYLFAHRIRGGGNFDAERMSAYLDLPSPEALRDRLRQDGITHVVIVNAPPPRTTDERKLAERSTQLTAAAQRMLAQTLDHYAANIVSRAETTVFTLR